MTTLELLSRLSGILLQLSISRFLRYTGKVSLTVLLIQASVILIQIRGDHIETGMRKPHANLDQLIPLFRHSSLFNREHREAEATLDSDIHVLTNHGLLFLCRADMKWHSPKIACHHSFAYPLKTKHAEIHAPPH